MKRLALLVVMLLAATPLFAQKTLGGKYFQLIWTEDGNSLQSENDLILIPHHGIYNFQLTVKLHDGTTAWIGTDEADVLKIENGHLWYMHPNKNYEFELELDLNPVGEDGEPMQDCIKVIEHVGESGSPYPAEVVFGGIYSRVIPTFTDENGYLYQMREEDGCDLISGGIYSGTVKVPEKVLNPWLDQMVWVRGLDSFAFSGCYEVTGVEFEGEGQYMGPSAFINSGIPYDYESLAKPRFAYPNGDFSYFVVPSETPAFPDLGPNQWMVFKQNIVQVQQCGDTSEEEDKDLGINVFNFQNTRGIFYYWPEAEGFAGDYFRGYEPYEVINLIASSDYVARHRFPSFSRWKFGEPEREADPFVVEQVLNRYPGHTVMYSRRVANIRRGSGDGELSMVEFEHKDGRAMVVFVWRNADYDLAFGDLSVDLDADSEEYGVWDIDDEGRYGIPDVVTIALDPQDNVTLFIAKNSPEAVECYAWHQAGDRLEYVDYGSSWYRFVD